MTQPSVLTTVDHHVATLTLNRPDVRNAFNDEVIASLTAQVEALATRPDVRCIVLAASGSAFCAGADLNWMRRMADYTREENLADATALARMMHTLYACPKPTVARIQGDVYAGGTGLVAACDVAVSVDTAQFCLSEVKLGLIPATISPYVIRAMGARAAHRYFLTAERFSAAEAHRIGLANRVVPAAEVVPTARAWAERIVPVSSDVKISWNGARAETQESIMLGARWDRVLENVRSFIEVRDAHAASGGNRCRVTFQMTFLETNVGELADIVRLAAELGVDRVKGHHLWAPRAWIGGRWQAIILLPECQMSRHLLVKSATPVVALVDHSLVVTGVTHDQNRVLSVCPRRSAPRAGGPGIEPPQPFGGHRSGAAPGLIARAGLLVSGSEIFPRRPHPAGGSLAGVRPAKRAGEQRALGLARTRHVWAGRRGGDQQGDDQGGSVSLFLIQLQTRA